MVAAFKGIKASRLKDDAVRLALLNAQRKWGNQVIKEDFEATTRTWDHKPKFVIMQSLSGGGATVLIVTDDKVWNWLNKGTPPHNIWAGVYTGKSRKKVLAFPSAFSPKTTPRSLKSGPGRKGGSTIHTPYVRHPGTEAREWTKIIAKKRTASYKKAMQQAMIAGARKTGQTL